LRPRGKVVSFIERELLLSLEIEGRIDAARPQKNQRPEVITVIEDLALVWCEAMGIPPSSIEISTSSRNRAMNFIEVGSELILNKLFERKTIENRVIALRNRMKKAASEG